MPYDENRAEEIKARLAQAQMNSDSNLDSDSDVNHVDERSTSVQTKLNSNNDPFALAQQGYQNRSTVVQPYQYGLYTPEEQQRILQEDTSGPYIDAINKAEREYKEKAKQQNVIDQFGNFLVQLGLGEIVFGTFEGFLDLFDGTVTQLGRPFSNDFFYEDPFNKEIHELKNKIRDDWFKIYQKDLDAHFEFTDPGWFFNNATSIATTVSLMIPSIAGAKALSLAGKATRATKAINSANRFVSKGLTKVGSNLADKSSKIDRAVGGVARSPELIAKELGHIDEAIGTAFLSRTAEGYMEGRETRDNAYSDAIDEFNTMSSEERASFIARNPEFAGMSDDDIAHTLANRAALSTFDKNYRLLLMDALQYRALGSFFNNSSNSVNNARVRLTAENARRRMAGEAEKAITKKARLANNIKYAVTHPVKSLAVLEPLEGLEEMLQYGFSENSEGDVKKYFDPNYTDRSFTSFLTDPAMWEQGLWGAIGGIAFGAAYKGGQHGVQRLNAFRKFKKGEITAEQYEKLRQSTSDVVVKELESSSARAKELFESLQAIEEGRNPFAFEIDPETGKRTKKKDGISETIREEEKDRYRNELLDNFVKDSVFDAIDNGYYNLLRDVLDSNEFEKYAKTTMGEDLTQDTRIKEEVGNKMTKVADSYTAALRNVFAEGGDNPFVTRMAARHVVRNNMAIENIDDILGSITQIIDNLNQSHEDFSGNRSGNIMAVFGDKAQNLLDLRQHYESEYASRNISYDAYIAHKNEIDSQLRSLLNFVSNNVSSSEINTLKFFNDFQSIINGTSEYNLDDALKAFNELKVNYSDKSANPSANINSLQRQEAMLLRDRVLLNTRTPRTKSDFKQIYEDFEIGFDAFVQKKIDGFFKDIEKYLRNADDIDTAVRDLLTNNPDVVGEDLSDALSFLKYGFIDLQSSRTIGQSFINQQFKDLIDKVKKERLDSEREEQENRENGVIVPDVPESTSDTDSSTDNNGQTNNNQTNNRQTGTNTNTNIGNNNTDTNTNDADNNIDQDGRRNSSAPIDVLPSDEITDEIPNPDIALLDEQEDTPIQNPDDVIDDADPITVAGIKIQHEIYKLAYSNSTKFKEIADQFLNGNDKEYNDLINKIVADFAAKYKVRDKDIRGFVEKNVGFTIGMVAAQTKNAKIIQFAQMVAVNINEHDAKHYSVTDLIAGKNITDNESTIISDFLEEYCKLTGIQEINGKKVINVSELFNFLLSDKCNLDNNTIAKIYNNLGLYIDNVKDSKYLFSGFDVSANRMTAEEFIEKLNVEKNFDTSFDMIHIFPLRPEERTKEVEKAILHANNGGKCIIKTAHEAAGVTHLDVFVKMPSGKKGTKEVKIGTLRTINTQESNTEGFRIYTPVSHFSGFKNAMKVDSNDDITLDCDFLFGELLDKDKSLVAKELFDILQEYQIGIMTAVKEYKDNKDEKKYKENIEKLLSDDKIKTVLNNELIKSLLDTGSYKYYLGAIGKDVLTDKQKTKQLVESINAILFCNAGNSNLTAQENSEACNMNTSDALQSYLQWKRTVYTNYIITNELQKALETESTGVAVELSAPIGVFANTKKDSNEYSNVSNVGFDTDPNSSSYNKLVIVRNGRLIDENGKDVGRAPTQLASFSMGYVTYNSNGIIRVATCNVAQSLNNTNKELVAQLQEHIEHIFQMQLNNTDDTKHEDVYKEINDLLNSLFGNSRLFRFSSAKGNQFKITKDKDNNHISITCNGKNVVTFHKKYSNGSNSNAITIYDYRSLDNNGNPRRITVANLQNNRQLISSVINTITANVRLNRYDGCFKGNKKTSEETEKKATNSLFTQNGDKSFTLHLYDKNGNKIDKQYNNYGDFVIKNRGFNTSAYKENGSFTTQTIKYHKIAINTKIRDTNKDIAIEGTPVSDILFSSENKKQKTVDTQDVLLAAGISQEKIDVLFGKNTGLRLVNTKIYADHTERDENDQTKAYYDKKTKRIYITPLGARVMENNPNNALRLILHENFHRLFSLKSSYNEKERKRIIRDLKDVYDYVVEQLNNDIKNNIDGKADLYQQILNVLNTATSYEDDDINMEEFFVECFTQKVLVDYLNNKNWRSSIDISGIPQQKKSIFQRILDILLDLLGIESTHIRNNSILAREYQIFTRDNVDIGPDLSSGTNSSDNTSSIATIDPNIQRGVDKITEIKETFGRRIKRDLNFNENHTYLLDGKPVDISVTQHIHGNTDVGLWGTPSSTLGTSIDIAARNHFAHKEEGIPNVEHEDDYGQHPKENTDLAVKRDMKKIEEYLDKKFGAGRYAVITEEFPIGGVLHKDGKDVTIAGTMDMVVVDDQGNIYIYDFKTKRANNNPDFDDKTLHQYSKQLNMYKELIEANFPDLKGKVHIEGLVKFLTNYPAPSDTTINGEKHHVEYRRSPDNENQLQISIDNEEFVDVQNQNNTLEYIAPYLADDFIIDPITESSGEQITGLPKEQSQDNQENKEEIDIDIVGVDSGFNNNTADNNGNIDDNIDEDYDASDDFDLNDDELFSRTDLIEDPSATKPEGVYVSNSQRNRLNEVNLNRNNNVRRDISPKSHQEMTLEQRIVYNAVRKMLRNSGIEVQELSEDAINALVQAQLMTVYHGSGADFNEFDHSHMGEGEGAQMFGWGSYVTEVKGIGRSYAENMGMNKRYGYSFDTYIGKVTKLTYKNHDIDNMPQDKLNIINDVIRLIQIKSSSKDGIVTDWGYIKTADEWNKIIIDNTIQEMINDINFYNSFNSQGATSHFAYGKKYLYELTADDFDISVSWRHVPTRGILYTVDIPDNTGKNYLDWDNFYNVETIEKIFNNLTDDIKGKLNQPLRGSSIYNLLTMTVGNDKKASQYLSSLGFTGIVYPANYTTSGREDGAKNYVIFNEKDLKIKDKIQLMQNKDRVVYGATVGGKIYLNGERLNPESPIHEYTHIWDSACKEKNPELWKRGVELLKQTSLWEQVKNDPNYADIKDDEDRVASEVHSRLTGKDGVALLEEMAKGNTPKGVIAKLKQWLKDFWWWCKDTFSPWTREEAERMSIDDFVNVPLKDLAQGRDLHGENIRYATTNSIEDSSSSNAEGARKAFSDRYGFLNNDNKKTTVEIFSQPIADGATISTYGVVSINNLNDFINEFPLQYRQQIEQLLNDSEFNFVCS